ncbi:MAG: class I SAM-dependent methyltransferase, partial [Acidimicrobiales bacterium]
PRSRPLFARCYGALARRAERGQLGVRRRAMISSAAGRVLDLGAGPGGSFEHFGDAVTAVVAVDPDPAMVGQARSRLAGAAAPVRLVLGAGERLPFADHSFDSVVVALVLCTVEDPTEVAAEVHRVLRPGGRLLFMEHVRARDEELAAWQDRVQRPWSWCNGGCRPNRASLDIIREAGFRLGPVECYGFPVLPHVQGEARREDG